MAEQGRLTARPRPAGGTMELEGVVGLGPLGLDRARDGFLYVPEGYRAGQPAPLVLMLHGAGADGRQMLSVLTPLADANGCLILAPDARGRTWDMLVDEYGPDVRFIDRALGHVFARYTIDPAHLAIGGFSDGASYALSLGLINGHLFTHVLAFSPGFMAPTRERDAPRFFVAHGLRDQVLPIERTSRRVVPNLRRAGYEVEYREFEGGHEVPLEIAQQAIGLLLN